MRVCVRSAVAISLLWFAAGAIAAESHQATGVKVGEVDNNSARVWVRRTLKAERNAQGRAFRGPANSFMPLPDDVSADDFEGAAPGAPGKARVRYGTKPDLSDARTTDWVDLSPDNDYAHTFDLTGLAPNTTYFFVSETAPTAGEPLDAPLKGSFTTAPEAHERIPVTFTVVTGMAYKDIDHPEGFRIYQSMLDVTPQFIVPTGDTVYYDSEAPRATTVNLARYHWQRMYAMPRHIAFHALVPGYWEKDDHDTWYNDCWPTMSIKFMAPLTYEQGHKATSDHTPTRNWYRTVRWGKGVQIWLLEVRDFRSPNNMPDGPEKSILGPEQKAWLLRTLAESDADWRIIISPTPIVGPDRANKRDNHANDAFAHEGNELRNFIRDLDKGNTFVCCGDRHWQYHSIDPVTKVHEFSCGPASNKHAGGTPGLNETYHQFHRVNGGFLSVHIEPAGDSSNLTFRFHDVKGQTVYQYVPPRAK